MTMFGKSERVIVFIDGSNLYSCAQALGFDIDYAKLHDWLHKRVNEAGGKLVRLYYYTAIPRHSIRSQMRGLTVFLSHHGYSIVSKDTSEHIDEQGRSYIKGNMDVEIAVDMMKLAATAADQHFVLFSGDSDFTYLLETIQYVGVKTSVVSSICTHPPMAGERLRRQADQFIELNDIKTEFIRTYNPIDARLTDGSEIGSA